MKSQLHPLYVFLVLTSQTSAWNSSAPSEVPLYGLSPPVYPSPASNGTTSPEWAAAYNKAWHLLSLMTLEEKVNVTRGFTGSCAGNTGAVPRLGIRPICFADAPDGIRGTDFVSAFPSQLHLAATFDRDLMYAYGKAVGQEYYHKGVNVALGPVAGPLGRVARGGRNWEALSSDPYLSGQGMGKAVSGMQDAGVIATAKHFLLNEQEFRRMPNMTYEWFYGEAISSNVDDRTLHELYAWPFYDALKAGAGAVLCSYQRANNSYACQNSKLMNGILKTEMGFEGFVVSDWQGQHAGVASANAGLDVVMPDGGFWGDNLTQAVTNGSVAEDRLNDMVARLFASYYYVGQEEYPEVGIFADDVQHPIVDVRADHASIIREIGAAGTVLVKNVNGTLPLKSPKFVSVYGFDADLKAEPWENVARYGGGYEVNFGWNTFNGTLITGGGSGGASPPYIITPFRAIQDRVLRDHGIVRWNFWSDNPHVSATTQVCIVLINNYASESFDRPSLVDDFSDRLVNNVATNCSNTVVVIHSAGIRVVDAWIEHSNVTAVVFAGTPGQESGNSLVDVLYGAVNPSGKLPYTVAKQEADYGQLLNSSVDLSFFPQSDFTEGLYIDYRHFDRLSSHPNTTTSAIIPRFEFGHGLSYTTFAYTNLTITYLPTANTAPLPPSNTSITQGGHPALWHPVLLISCTVANTGPVPGHEVAQLYLGIPNAPVRQLRGFERVWLEAGGGAKGATEVVFEVTRRDLSVWDTVVQEWRLQRGVYGVWVGASSRDLRLEGSVVF